MAGLQRSSTTFRRSGSSGLVWDERFFYSGDLNMMKKKQEEAGVGQQFSELRYSKSVGAAGTMGRSHAFHAGAISPVVDPPSPEMRSCLCCGFMGKHSSNMRSKQRRR